MTMRKIAHSGMKGRKRDTRLLRAVIVLSFLFITVATILLASRHATEQAQRNTLYGAWQLLDGFATDADVEHYRSAPGVDAFASTRLLHSEYTSTYTNAQQDYRIENPCGTIGTIDEAFYELGCLRLQEGRLPETVGEIALEANQLGRFSGDVGLGSTITVYTYFDYYPAEDGTTPTEPEQQYRFTREVTEAEMEDYRSQVPGWLESNFYNYASQASWYYAVYSDGGKRTDAETVAAILEEWSLDDLTMIYLAENVPELLDTSVEFRTTTNEPFNYGEVHMLLSSELEGQYFLSDYATPEEAAAAQRSDITPYHQTLRVQRSYVITGILETYSDRWDSGWVPMPNSFVTVSAAEEHDAAIASIESALVASHENANANTHVAIMASNSLTAGELFVRCTRDVVYPITGIEYTDEELASGEQLPTVAGFTARDVESGAEVYIPVTSRWEFRGYRLPSTPQGANEELEEAYDEILCFSYAGESYECTISEISGGMLALPGLEPLPYPHVPADAYHGTSTTSFLHANSFAYPLEGDTASTLNFVVVGVIFITTVCAVFQIFLTQLNRRARRMALMKSVGATNGQVAALLLWECVYLLLFSLPIGTALGLALSYAAVQAMAGAGGDALLFTIDPTTLAGGLFSGAAAVFLGMIAPLVRAVHTPLVGRVAAVRPRRVRARKTPPPKKQTFARVCWRNVRTNRTRTLGTLALSTFIITILLVCVFLGFHAFSTYHETVLRAGKADYQLEAPYGVSVRVLPEFTAQMQEPVGIESVDVFKLAEHVYLSFDNMLESPILGPLQSHTTPSGFSAAFETPEADRYLADAQPAYSYVTTLYGFDVDTTTLARLSAAVTEGEIDAEKLREGEEVILLVPLYHATDGAPELSLSSSKASYYEEDRTISVGDSVYISGVTQSVTESGVIASLAAVEPRVAAIIRYFPETGVWPFSGDCIPYTVISGNRLITQIYNNANVTLSASEAQIYTMMSNLFSSYSHGKTQFFAYAKEDAERLESFLPLLTLSRDNGFTIVNHHDSNVAFYADAINNALLTALLGVAISMIALVILGNTLASAVQQERRRTGVLQALGVTKSRFRLQQAALAFANGAAAIIIANLVIGLILLGFSLAENAGLGLTLGELFADIANTILWRYPWQLHGACCAVFFAALFVLHLSPLKDSLSHSPIENIRS